MRLNLLASFHGTGIRVARWSWLWCLLLPLHGAEPEALLEKWLQHQAGLETWQAKVTQIRSLQSLAQPLTNSGRIWASLPRTFRWELGDPPRTIAIRTPDQLTLAYPMLDRVEHHDLQRPSSEPARQALALLDAGFPRDRKSLEDRFRIARTSIQSGNLRVLLIPRDRRARQMLERIRLEIDAQDLQLKATELHFADGSTLRNEFHHPVRNPKLSPALFRWQDEPPPAREITP